MTLDEAIQKVANAPEGKAIEAYEEVLSEYKGDDAELVMAWLAESAALTDFEGEDI
jgi:hypothetical protein